MIQTRKGKSQAYHLRRHQVITLKTEVRQEEDVKRVMIEAEHCWRPRAGWFWSLRGKFNGRWYGFRDQQEMDELLGSLPDGDYCVSRRGE